MAIKEMSRSSRVIIERDPYIRSGADLAWDALGQWPCAWVHLPEAGEPPLVVAYRRRFTLDAEARIRIHVSADARYDLYLDGALIGRGSESGDPANWFYETYDLSLSAGAHVLVARVWSLGRYANLAQMSAHHGFILSAEGERLTLLGTGVAEWSAKPLDGYSFSDPAFTWATGAGLQLDGKSFPWGYEQGDGDGWRPVSILERGYSAIGPYGIAPLHRLQPATLPAMVDELRQAGTVRLVAEAPSIDTAAIPVRAADHRAAEGEGWQSLLQGKGAVTVPPHSTRRVIIDLGDYYCARSRVVTSGGAGSLIRLHWAEALFEEPRFFSPKGNRGVVEGKFFVGVGDTFLPDGDRGRAFEGLWWQAGRYVEVVVHTESEPLTIEHLQIRETRYPLELESRFTASDPALERVTPILVRAMQMCAHETYMDCPYYERLMYVGDTRLEALTTYVMMRDDRLPRKALRMFDASRLATGLTQARYPCRQLQVIPPFSLWWVAMVRDYALWRDDRSLVEELMPGVHAVLERYSRSVQSDGLLHAPEGWNVTDWVPAWKAGLPAEAVGGVSGLLNWQFVYVLGLVAELEDLLGRPQRAAEWRRQACELAHRAAATFWDEPRGLFADDRAHRHFSEHTQCLAVLSGQLDPAQRSRVAEGLLNDSGLARTTIYFSHYLFEAYRELGLLAALFGRLSLWFSLEEQGFKTTLEHPEPSRSDCHAWGAHPLFHYFATILGIRPTGLGFRNVVITPQLGPLERASGRLVHPLGEVVVEVERADGTLHGRIELPQGVSGVLRLAGRSLPLAEGSSSF